MSCNLDEDTDLLLKELKAGKYAFIDAGTSAGNSLQFCKKVFGCGDGIGLDRNPNKVAKARASGHSVARCELGELELPPGCVSFCSMMDFLEHLPDLQTAEKVLVGLARAARDFVFIRHPSFEDVDYLKERGLKIGWTDWHGHPNAMLIEDFRAIFERQGWNEYVIIAQKPIADSSHPAMLAFDGPRDVVTYDEAVHGPKPKVKFDKPIYTQFDLLVRLGGTQSDSDWQRLAKKLRKWKSVVL